MAIAAAGFDGPNRIIYSIDGEYLMESIDGGPMYSSTTRAGTIVVQVAEKKKLTGGETLDVIIATGRAGEAVTAQVKIYSITFVKPPAAAFGWVKSIEPAAPGLTVVFDRVAFDDANRFQVRQNRAYLMESYKGDVFYSSKTYDGANAVLKSSATSTLTFASGDLIEVYLASGTAGSASQGRWCIASYTCP